MDNFTQKHQRMQLITPYVSDKIYHVSSIKKAAKKCYSELKPLLYSKYATVDTFSIMDLDSYETYKFGINRNTQVGGDNNIQETNPPEIKVVQLEGEIRELKAEIERLRSRLNITSVGGNDKTKIKEDILADKPKTVEEGDDVALGEDNDDSKSYKDNPEPVKTSRDVYNTNLERLETMRETQKDEIRNTDTRCNIL